MRALYRLTLAAIVSAGFISPLAIAAQADDEQAIKLVEAGWQDAWNRHDMDALAALFTEDASFVQVAGRRWDGTAEIRKNHALLHAMQFKESVWTNRDLDIRFLAPDVALIHQTWSMAGDKNPDGTPRPPRDGIFTQVFVKRDGKWLITASQNTNIIVIPGSAVAGSMPAK